MLRERAAQEETSNAALIAEFDNVQATIEVDALFTYSQLKNKSFEEIQKLYEKEQKWIKDFISMDSEEVEKKATNSKKIPRAEPDEESVKRQRIGETSGLEAYQIFADILKKFDRDDMVKLWDLVKKRFSTTEPTNDKKKELLYNTCGVHHVSSVRGHDIFMLVEKEYPLTIGTLGLMMVARPLVEADSEMSRELLRKIFYQANRPRQCVKSKVYEWYWNSKDVAQGNWVEMGYSQSSKAYIIINKHTRKIEESLNVTFNETPPPSKTSPLVDDDLDKEEAIKVTKKKNQENDIEDETLEIDEIVNIKESRNHTLENVIGNLNQRTLSWIVAMQEELNQSIANDVWELVSQPRNMTIIGTKCVFRNKLDENGVISRNKARILLAYAYALDFKLFQMDVKSAFLNGFINEEVYVAQPPGFIDFEKPDHVYKLKKALYGLKQAPKAWYDRLKAFLIKHEYKMGMVDNILFSKKKSLNLIIVQIYVDDIIFGSTCQDMCDEFAKIMHDEFEMSMMGELNFFLGLQIKQMEDGIFFNQSKYIKEMLKKFGLEDSKPMKTPMSSDTKLTKDEECESVDSTKYRGMIGTTHIGLWYPKGTGIETVVYADSDHAEDYVDQKSTSGICTFVGCCLTSWFSKKQTALAISTIQAEYVSTEKACQQAL
ncbi:retrovirus-related pol polyprotein from transposon TNT 1-94 [Tanacetum coccineum]